MASSRSPLAALATPKSIVIFGASPDRRSMGGVLTDNLIGGSYSGAVHLVNPKYRQVGKQTCHTNLAAVGCQVDLALIATPAESVGEILEQCGAARVKAAVIYSAGFSETGERGQQREAELKEIADRHHIRLLGPRAVGFLRPHLGVNAVPFQRAFAAGNLAFVSQSGAVCTGILDWVFADDFALSALFAPGNGCDLDLPEFLDFLARDVETQSILLYLEGPRDRRRFMSALRAAARMKPVVVVKSGRHPLSARVAGAHIGVVVGDDEVFDAALRRAGALRVRSIGDLFSAARALTSRQRPRGNRLAVVTNGGGPAVAAADEAAERGIHLARLGADTCAALAVRLPASWSMDNPVDILFDADPERFRLAIELCSADDGIDGTLVIISPSAFFDPPAVAQAIVQLALTEPKPLLACVIGEGSVREARQVLAAAGVPTFRTPESAVAAFAFMVDFVRHQELLLETPPAQMSHRAADVTTARAIVDQALRHGRVELDTAEGEGLLAAFHIPLASASRKLGGKLREIRVALKNDPGFGPVIIVGEGGSAADIAHAGAVVLPPLNHRLIIDLFRQPAVTRLFEARMASPAISPPLLSQVLQRVSELACEMPCIDNLEINPLCGDGGQLYAESVRITLRPAGVATWRYGHMAICPYPLALESSFITRAGTSYRIRPILHEDATAFQMFIRRLSNRSRYCRFFSAAQELTPRELSIRTQIDYDREMLLIAVLTTADEQEEIVAEADYSVLPDDSTCEFGVAVADSFAGQGIGTRILQQLMEAARRRGLTRIVGQVLSDNDNMQALMESLGFSVGMTDEAQLLDVSRRL